MKKLAGIMAALSMLPGIAYSWGYVGHEVVCEIAFQELTDTARQSVRNLLQNDSSPTFAKSCNWADEPDQKAERRPDHFINVPRCYYEIRGGQCRLGDRCLFSAIREDTNTLAYSNDDTKRGRGSEIPGTLGRGSASAAARVVRRRLGGQQDQGVRVVLRIQPARCLGRLHHQEQTRLECQDIARELRQEITDSQREKWSDSTAVDWADESYDIARRGRAGLLRKRRQRLLVRRRQPAVPGR